MDTNLDRPHFLHDEREHICLNHSEMVRLYWLEVLVHLSYCTIGL